MKHIYIIFGVLIVGFVVYQIGAQLEHSKCMASNAIQYAQQQTSIVKTLGKINETVNNSDTDYIRRILREKYTIAE